MTQIDDVALGYGLRILSPIPIPGAMRIAADEGVDVVVEFGAAPRWTERAAAGPYRAASVDLFDFAMPDLACFTCIDRNRILIDPQAGADASRIAEMLVATVLPALLWTRGAFVLHAAAAVFPGATTAIAVAGASGSGKSHWLARAVELGATVIADDSLCIRFAEGRAIASGLPGGFYRRFGAAADDREFCAVSPERQCATFPLGAIGLFDGDRALATRLAGGAAVAALLRHRHRPRIASLLGLEPALLPVVATIARAVPVVGL